MTETGKVYLIWIYFGLQNVTRIFLFFPATLKWFVLFQEILFDYKACFKFIKARTAMDTYEDLESEAL